MNLLPRQLGSLTATVTMLTMALACSGAMAEGVVAPLPGSDYSVTAVCPAPAPRHAGCLALQLVPSTTAARERTHPIGMARPASRRVAPARSPAAGDFGLRPQDLHSAYRLPAAPASEQTVALVDAYNDPTAEADLETYDREFGLPACTTANGCFAKVGESGSKESLPFPKTSSELEQASKGTAAEARSAEEASGWGAEISLDIESAHATCEGCHILLVEANTSSYADLGAAEASAVRLGAREVSNSWGGPEEGVENDESGPFNDPGVVITAAAGDTGFRGWDAEQPEERGVVNYPAASPRVVAVGGTRLTLGAEGAWAGETVWNGDGASGGGCSIQFAAPAWQQQAADWSLVGCGGKRAVADVAADADPHTGVAIVDSSPACESEYVEGGVRHTLHWCTYGGTSLASPIIAAMFALAGGANGVAYPAKTLYESRSHAPGTLHDITVGSNGECSAGFDLSSGLSHCEPSQEAQASCPGQLSCLAGAGYDGPSGVGSPNGILGFQPGQEEASAREGAPGAAPSEAPAVVPPPPNPASAVAPSTPPSPAAPAPALPALRVGGLTLTPRALLALNRHRPWGSLIGFSFMSNIAGRLRITLSVKRRVRGHARWQSVTASTTAAVLRGRNGRHLSGRRGLPAGLYRLTLTPPSGSASSISFHIG